jgi:hypothetical protein
MGQDEGRGRGTGVWACGLLAYEKGSGGLGLIRVGDGAIVMGDNLVAIVAIVEGINVRSGLGRRAGHRCRAGWDDGPSRSLIIMVGQGSGRRRES